MSSPIDILTYLHRFVVIIDVLLVLNEFLELLLGKLVGDVGEVAAVVLAIVNGRIRVVTLVTS